MWYVISLIISSVTNKLKKYYSASSISSAGNSKLNPGTFKNSGNMGSKGKSLSTQSSTEKPAGKVEVFFFFFLIFLFFFFLVSFQHQNQLDPRLDYSPKKHPKTHGIPHHQCLKYQKHIQKYYLSSLLLHCQHYLNYLINYIYCYQVFLMFLHLRLPSIFYVVPSRAIQKYFQIKTNLCD